MVVLVSSANLGKKGRTRETFPDIVRRIPLSALHPFLRMTQVSAAKAMGISPTTLKKLCRHYRIPRWPFRQITGIGRVVDDLQVHFEQATRGPSQALSSVKSDVHGLPRHRDDAVELALERERDYGPFFCKDGSTADSVDDSRGSTPEKLHAPRFLPPFPSNLPKRITIGASFSASDVPATNTVWPTHALVEAAPQDKLSPRQMIGNTSYPNPARQVDTVPADPVPLTLSEAGAAVERVLCFQARNAAVECRTAVASTNANSSVAIAPFPSSLPVLSPKRFSSSSVALPPLRSSWPGAFYSDGTAEATGGAAGFQRPQHAPSESELQALEDAWFCEAPSLASAHEEVWDSVGTIPVGMALLGESDQWEATGGASDGTAEDLHVLEGLMFGDTELSTAAITFAQTGTMDGAREKGAFTTSADGSGSDSGASGSHRDTESSVWPTPSEDSHLPVYPANPGYLSVLGSHSCY